MHTALQLGYTLGIVGIITIVSLITWQYFFYNKIFIFTKNIQCYLGSIAVSLIIFLTIIYFTSNNEYISSHLTPLIKTSSVTENTHENIATLIKSALGIYPVGAFILLITTLFKDIAIYGHQDNKQNIKWKIICDGCKCALLIMTFTIILTAVI